MSKGEVRQSPKAMSTPLLTWSFLVADDAFEPAAALGKVMELVHLIPTLPSGGYSVAGTSCYDQSDSRSASTLPKPSFPTESDAPKANSC